jgi:hypothetical protein
MYQIHVRAQASKLVALAARWQITRVQQHAAAPRQRAPRRRGALAELANLAALRAMPGSLSNTAERHDPCDPRNW